MSRYFLPIVLYYLLAAVNSIFLILVILDIFHPSLQILAVNVFTGLVVLYLLYARFLTEKVK